MVETPPAVLRVPFLELPVKVSLEHSMGSYLTAEQCQLTDASVPGCWQDYGHL